MPSVYSSRPAEPGQAAWLQRLLGPLKDSCRFRRLPPLEIRQIGKWGGWCSNIEAAPDGRVSLSTKIVFWNDEQLTEIYLHECTHRLLGANVDAHGPEFLCTNLILLMRAATSFEQDLIVSKLSFYDCQDRPAALLFESGWRSIVIDWSLAVAAEFAPTTIAAEDLAEVVCARWLVHVEEFEEEREQSAQRVQQVARAGYQRIAQLRALRSSRSLFAWLAGVGWVGLFGVFVVLFNL